jgi:hypothetical protein
LAGAAAAIAVTSGFFERLKNEKNPPILNERLLLEYEAPNISDKKP